MKYGWVGISADKSKFKSEIYLSQFRWASKFYQKHYTFLQGSWDTWDGRATKKKNCKFIMWKSTEILTKDPLLRSGRPLHTWNLVHSVNKRDTGHNNENQRSCDGSNGKIWTWGVDDVTQGSHYVVASFLSTSSYGTIPLSKRIIFKAPVS